MQYPSKVKIHLTRYKLMLASGLLLLLVWLALVPQAARSDGGGWPTATPTPTQAVIIISPATAMPQPDTNLQIPFPGGEDASAPQPDIIFEIVPEATEPALAAPIQAPANPPAETQKSGSNLSLIAIFGALVLAAAAASLLVLRMRRR